MIVVPSPLPPGTVPVDQAALTNLLASVDRILGTSAATEYLRTAREAFRATVGAIT